MHYLQDLDIPVYIIHVQKRTILFKLFASLRFLPPSLFALASFADLFEDRTPDQRRWQEAETWDKGHRRLEHRQIVCSPDLSDWFANEWIRDPLWLLFHPQT
jgi:hypothetical protein